MKLFRSHLEYMEAPEGPGEEAGGATVAPPSAVGDCTDYSIGSAPRIASPRPRILLPVKQPHHAGGRVPPTSAAGPSGPARDVVARPSFRTTERRTPCPPTRRNPTATATLPHRRGETRRG